jgi:phosphoadenosine phosphosulfate reductase
MLITDRKGGSTLSLSRTLSQEELNNLASKFEDDSPQSLLHWGAETYGEGIVLACSFGAEDVVLLDMLLNINPHAPVFYLDTDKHFQETYDTRDRLEERYNISFIQVKAQLTLQEQAEKHGEKLWESQPDLCCEVRKVKPLTRILGKYEAWITGIRREQSFTRATVKKVEWDQKFQMIKLNPLASWSYEEVWGYIREHGLPYNPLHDQNYPSIGCSVCTQPVQPGEDPRAGRWSAHQKTECGLHK